MFTVSLESLSAESISIAGGKNAALGEMISKLSKRGINVPSGFATTVSAYRHFIISNKLMEPLSDLFSKLDTKAFTNLETIGASARTLLERAFVPDEISYEISKSYDTLCNDYGHPIEVAVRSSATAEDMPSASFAGQHDSFLNIKGTEAVLAAVKKCFVSLFNDRAIKYRHDNNFGQLDVAISAGIQKMVRADLASSGVAFTIDPESGFKDVFLISGSWGLGENVVQGKVNPDEFIVFKPKFIEGKNAIISKKLGGKEKTLIYESEINNRLGNNVVNIDTPHEKRNKFILSDAEIKILSGWLLLIEQHFNCPMDVEWAKDGIENKLYIVQARPETVHSKKDPFITKKLILLNKGKVLAQGNAVGSGIASGIARILNSPAEAYKLQPGEVLVTDITNPDWDPILKKASAIITDKGGRTSHAAIVAREIGAVAVVGCINATSEIKEGQMITVSCSQGKTGFVYEGKLNWQEHLHDFRKIKMPKTSPMFILGDPDKAFQYSFYPNNGVGLVRMEFIINNTIQIHPMALINYENLTDKNARNKINELTSGYQSKEQYFIDKLSLGISTIAAAFYPKDVIVRMSDFKSNEYANLIGGKEFEPDEENPMIGFRGASRYYNTRYKEGFRLECEAMKVIRNNMGLTNVKLMIPFCRTVEEAKIVVELMEQFGLKRGVNNLEIYMMTEIPSNVLLAEEFAQYFDGFSIGSNDLTQLTLGIDRDSHILGSLFDERNAATKQLISLAIIKAKKAGKKTGLCGQAPSDFPDFTEFLVEQGIDSISFNPDALLRGIENINLAESKKLSKEKFLLYQK